MKKISSSKVQHLLDSCMIEIDVNSKRQIGYRRVYDAVLLHKTMLIGLKWYLTQEEIKPGVNQGYIERDYDCKIIKTSENEKEFYDAWRSCLDNNYNTCVYQTLSDEDEKFIIGIRDKYYPPKGGEIRII